MIIGLALTLITAGFAVAAPPPRPVLQNATFNDLPPDPVAGASEGLPVGYYRNLSWPGFNYGGDSSTTVPSIAQSQPIVGFTDLVTRTTAGVTNGTMTVAYPGTKAQYFNLEQFYYSVELEDTTTFSAPVQATFEVVGFGGSGTPVAVQRFTSPPPPAPLDSVMYLAQLSPQFTKLTSATFSVVKLFGNSTLAAVPPAVAATSTVLAIDNVIYEVVF